MKLINEVTGQVVKAGDTVTTRAGFPTIVAVVAASVGAPPHKPSSSGRIYVENPDGWGGSYFPHVFQCKWVEDVVEPQVDENTDHHRTRHSVFDLSQPVQLFQVDYIQTHEGGEMISPQPIHMMHVVAPAAHLAEGHARNRIAEAAKTTRGTYHIKCVTKVHGEIEIAHASYAVQACTYYLVYYSAGPSSHERRRCVSREYHNREIAEKYMESIHPDLQPRIVTCIPE